jgi:hypothetical protein
MCDYSLYTTKNRLAEQGEVLIVHRFHSGSIGLTSAEYLKPVERARGVIAILKRMFVLESDECAVCVPDGARLRLRGTSKMLREVHGVSAPETATFRQLSAKAATYRDAIELKNGVRISLQELEEGEILEILALSSSSEETWVLEPAVRL